MTSVLQIVKERGEFVKLEDGRYVYAPRLDAREWLTGEGGFWTAYQLRVIATELDRLNDML